MNLPMKPIAKKANSDIKKLQQKAIKKKQIAEQCKNAALKKKAVWIFSAAGIYGFSANLAALAFRVLNDSRVYVTIEIIVFYALVCWGLNTLRKLFQFSKPHLSRIFLFFMVMFLLAVFVWVYVAATT